MIYNLDFFFNFPEEQLINMFVFTWVYTMIWYSYTLWNDHWNQDNCHSCHFTYLTCVCVCVWVCLCIARILKMSSQQLSSIKYHIINYSHHAAHWSLRTYSSSKWKFMYFHLYFPIFPFPTAPGNHHSPC